MTVAKFSVRKRLLDFMSVCLPAAYAAYAQRGFALQCQQSQEAGWLLICYAHVHTRRVMPAE